MEWQGTCRCNRSNPTAKFRIDGLRAHTIWEYLEDRLNFAVNSGHHRRRCHLQFLAEGCLRICNRHCCEGRGHGSSREAQAIGRRLDHCSSDAGERNQVDLAKRQAHLDSLSLTGLKLMTWLEPDGSLNLLKLTQISSSAPAARGASAASKASPAAGSASAASDAPAAGAYRRRTAARAAPRGRPQPVPRRPTAAPWTFDLGEFALQDANISAEDRSTAPAAKVLLAPLSLKAAGVSLDLCKPVAVPSIRASTVRVL